MRASNWIVMVLVLTGGCRAPCVGPMDCVASKAASEVALVQTAEAQNEVTEVAASPVRSTKRSSGGAIRPASYQAAEEIPPPVAKPSPADALIPALDDGRRAVRDLDPASRDVERPPLTIREVSESVFVAFPALEALRQEMIIAEGKQLSAWGEFDFKVKAESFSTPLGYYENYRNLVKVEQGVFRNGGNLFGQYRIGDGNIQPWYGERQTNEGGEFKAGLILPLLRDRAIDQRRADIFQATLRRQQVDPMVQGALLEFNQAAAEAYWLWVAAGLNYDVQYDLLRVTTERNLGFEERVKLKDLSPIELVQNRRLIASREAKVIEALRKLQQYSIKLSLFLRDEQGQPAIPSPSLLPAEFPELKLPNTESIGEAIAAAMNARPELVDLDLQREQAEVDLAAGRNLRLPSVNATFDASKDVGAKASKSGDKSPFELEAGLLFDMPLQRRKAEGKIREAQGKLAQIAAKRQFMENKIEVQVRDAMSALATSHDRALRARESLALARQLEQAERDLFAAGESDLLRVAIQEAAQIEAAVTEIEATAEYFKSQAALEAALATDPLSRD